MPSVIKLEKVKKVYQLGETQVNALDGVDLNIDSKEFVAIVGPSGSGKSTLMHIIGLLDRPSIGSVYLSGKDVSRLTENETASLRNKHIGFVFQSFNLLARTSALDNVALPLIYAGIPESQRKEMAKESLEKVGLGDRIHHFSSQLSGGQQQRVAIARALVNNPTLVLADEPTGNLDSHSGKEIIALLRLLNSEGHTIVMVTHDMNIAANAKRIVEIRDGRIVRDRKKN